MPSIIRVLDDQTINQIAAGEVIENPSSVIKELIENALDAESSSIFIEVTGSGRHLIRITDNGIGMTKNDALLCFERHATSKVAKIEDLERLNSMGFRGEALASIGSIAKVRLITRQRDQEKGVLIEMHGGKLISTALVPCDPGTTLEVTDLFYNVPARRKFLKSVKQDLIEIQKMVTQISFAHPHVHFTLNGDGESLLEAPLVATYVERAEQLLHESVFESMVPFQFKEGDIHLEGLLGDPTVHRPNRTGQSLFINQRPVTSWELAQAVLEGYGSSLPERRYPVFHLHLTLPPHEFDINVHPQKKEVRFSHLSAIKDVVRKATARALHHKPEMDEPKIDFQPVWNTTIYPLKKEESREARAPAPYFEKEEALTFSQKLPLPEKTPPILASIPYYILLEAENGLELIDIQRAKKRIIYEEVLSGFQKSGSGKQILLVPLTHTFSEEESACIIQYLEEFASSGFSLRPFGKQTFMIESLPSFLKEEHVAAVLHEILEALTQNKNALQEQLAIQFAESSIKHIPKEERVLGKEEAGLLIKRLFACQQPFFTPSGQKIRAGVSLDELEKFFK